MAVQYEAESENLHVSVCEVTRGFLSSYLSKATSIVQILCDGRSFDQRLVCRALQDAA